MDGIRKQRCPKTGSVTKLRYTSVIIKLKMGKHITVTVSINRLKQEDILSPVWDLANRKTNIGLEIFANRDSEMILAYVDESDTVENSSMCKGISLYVCKNHMKVINEYEKIIFAF